MRGREEPAVRQDVEDDPEDDQRDDHAEQPDVELQSTRDNDRSGSRSPVRRLRRGSSDGRPGLGRHGCLAQSRDGSDDAPYVHGGPRAGRVELIAASGLTGRPSTEPGRARPRRALPRSSQLDVQDDLEVLLGDRQRTRGAPTSCRGPPAVVPVDGSLDLRDVRVLAELDGGLTGRRAELARVLPDADDSGCRARRGSARPCRRPGRATRTSPSRPWAVERRDGAAGHAVVLARERPRCRCRWPSGSSPCCPGRCPASQSSV